MHCMCLSHTPLLLYCATKHPPPNSPPTPEITPSGSDNTRQELPLYMDPHSFQKRLPLDTRACCYLYYEYINCKGRNEMLMMIRPTLNYVFLLNITSLKCLLQGNNCEHPTAANPHHQAVTTNS